MFSEQVNDIVNGVSGESLEKEAAEHTEDEQEQFHS